MLVLCRTGDKTLATPVELARLTDLYVLVMITDSVTRIQVDFVVLRLITKLKDL